MSDKKVNRKRLYIIIIGLLALSGLVGVLGYKALFKSKNTVFDEMGLLNQRENIEAKIDTINQRLYNEFVYWFAGF